MSLRAPSKTFLSHEDDNLLFDAIPNMIALGLADNAFDAPSLKSVEQIFQSQSPTAPTQSTSEVEDCMLKTPIFRQPLHTANGVQTSPDKALRYNTFNYYLQRLGRSTGFMEILTSYCIRRGTGNAVDGAFPSTYKTYLNKPVLMFV